MNIQQSLNQAFRSAGFFGYFTGESLDDPRDAGRAGTQASYGKENAAQQELHDTELTQKKYEGYKAKGLTDDQIKEELAKTPLGQKLQNVMNYTMQYPERQFRKYSWTQDEADALRAAHEFEMKLNQDKIFAERKAIMEQRALNSQRQKQQTAADQNQAVKDRMDWFNKHGGNSPEWNKFWNTQQELKSEGVNALQKERENAWNKQDYDKLRKLYDDGAFGNPGNLKPKKSQ